MPDFTPGPWKAYGIAGLLVDVRTVDGGIHIADLDQCEDAEDVANAHLIAAAPKMYEALEAMNSSTVCDPSVLRAAESALKQARGQG